MTQMTYRAPVRDLMFALSEIVEARALFATPAHRELDLETIRAVLEGAADFAETVLAAAAGLQALGAAALACA